MADQIDPSAIAKARAAGYSDAEIADHLAQSSPGVTKARAAGYSDKEILSHLGANMPSSDQPSGALAALGHATKENVLGTAETAKQLGIGNGIDAQPDGFVPANVTNGSANPLNWNWSQVPQKIAENAPGIAQDTVAGAAAKALLGKRLGPAAPLIGAALSALVRTGGNTVKDVTANNGDADPTLADKVRGFGTAAASSAVGSLTPTRFIPGANKVTSVGTAGVLDGIKKYLATTAIGAGSGAASDAVTQLGTKGSYDPAQGIEAAAGGGLTSGAMAAPRAGADVVGAARRAQFGGANADATAAYNNRLTQNAGAAGLGSAKGDYAAQENTKSGLKRELQQVDDSGLSTDTANALSLARSGAPLTDDHVSAIESADPQAGFLARQLRMAQQSEGIGSYDSGAKAWSGGLSGMADKYAVRPFKVHALIGGASSLGGALLGTGAVHTLGTYGLPFLGAAAGAYGIARGVDSLTGARSPAMESSARFADANVPTRLAPPPAPPTAAPSAPTPQAGPWGPRPGPTTTVPQVAPPAPQAPQFNPIALSTLKQTLKANAAAQAPPEPPVSPQAPVVTPEQDIAARLNPLALSTLKATLRRNELAQQSIADEKVRRAQADSENKQANKDFGANQTQAISENKARDKATEDEAAEQEKQAKVAAKITKASGGAVKVSAPAAPAAPQAPTASQADPWSHVGAYTPIAPEHMQFNGLAPAVIAKMNLDQRYAHLPALAKQGIFNSIVGTHSARDNAIAELTKQMPEHADILQALGDQLHEPGNSSKSYSRRAIKHFSSLLPGDKGHAVRSHYDRPDVQDAIWPPERKHTKKT